MLALTKKTDYALIALNHLAGHRNQVANARAIAERYHIPAALLMNIMKLLTHHGFVRSVRGSKGGYVLALEPAAITLYQLIVAIEGPVEFVKCAEPLNADGESSCDLLEVCPVSRPVRKIHERLSQFLKEVSLAEIAAEACCCGQHDNALPVSIGMPVESKS